MRALILFLLALALAPVFPGAAQTLPSERMGLIATRGGIPNTLDAADTKLMSRSYHIAADRIRSLHISLVNFYAPTGQGEIPGPAPAFVTCSIEYPLQVEHYCSFGGTSAATILQGGHVNAVVTGLDIPPRQGFWFREFFESSAGVIYSRVAPAAGQPIDAEMGDAMTVGPTTLDQTTGGTVFDSGLGGLLLPAALYGETRLPSIIIIGDSIAAGYRDYYDGPPDLGSVARTLGANQIAYINMAVWGDTAADFAYHDARRAAFFKLATHCIVADGSNDLGFGTSPTLLEYSLRTIYHECQNRGLEVFAGTIMPRSTSSDGWATLAAQAPEVPFTANALVVNDWIRSLPHMIAGEFDLADVVSSAPDSGMWIATGRPGSTTRDGIHPSHNEYLAIRGSGVIDVTAIHR